MNFASLPPKLGGNPISISPELGDLGGKCITPESIQEVKKAAS
jgi:hypothetical protein